MNKQKIADDKQLLSTTEEGIAQHDDDWHIGNNGNTTKRLSQLMATEETIIHEGPLPHPDMLRAYQSMIPDAAERFFALVEAEQKHRHENNALITSEIVAKSRAECASEKRGDFMCLFFFISCLLAGLWVLATGKSNAIAGTLLGAPVLASLGAFLFNRRKRKENHKDSISEEKSEIGN